MLKRHLGFTLIEMLIVVLIIAILAAIAFPKYQYAKEKSYLTEALIMKNAIDKAAERYYLTNGKKPESFTDLDIDMQGATCDPTGISCSTEHLSYYMAAGSYYKIRRPGAMFELEPSFYPERTFYCLSGPDYKVGVKFCQEICNTTTPERVTSYEYYLCR